MALKLKDRKEAGEMLANALRNYVDKDVIVYALPRGGVIPAIEIARALRSPLDLIIVRKIGHPHQPEYAVAAVAENGDLIGSEEELIKLNKVWLKAEVEAQRQEAKRRREKYLQGKFPLSAQGKIAILVDDGIATGLTIRIAIQELKRQQPQKIIVAVPVAPKSVAEYLNSQVDEIAMLDIPEDLDYLGAVGAYYHSFPQVEDEEVITLMKFYEKEYAETKKKPNAFK